MLIHCSSASGGTGGPGGSAGGPGGQGGTGGTGEGVTFIINGNKVTFGFSMLFYGL
jgi:hypothetical protein